MRHHTSAVFTAALVCPFLFTPASATEKKAAPTAPARVLLRYGAKLRVEKRVVDDGSIPRVYTIERTNGPWLWLDSDTVTGWAQRAETVPYAQALGYCSAEIAANPNRAWGYFARAAVRLEQGAYLEALNDLETVTRLSPGCAPAYLARSFAYVNLQQFDSALKEVDKALRQDARCAKAYGCRGSIWLMMGEPEKAMDDLNTALWLGPKHAGYLMNRALLFSMQADFDRALEDLAEALKIAPGDSHLYTNRGEVWLALKKADKAITDFNEAIRLNPADSLALSNRATAWYSKKLYQRALADNAEALRIDPANALAHAGMAWLLATCPDASFRDGRRAVEEATRACTLSEWKAPEYLSLLAAAHAEAGDFQAAIKYEMRACFLYSEEEQRELSQERIELYQNQQPYREAPERFLEHRFVQAENPANLARPRPT